MEKKSIRFKTSEMNVSEKKLWLGILDLSGEIFVDPKLGLKPYLDKLKPEIGNTKIPRVVENYRRGCQTPNEVTILLSQGSPAVKELRINPNPKELSPQRYDTIHKDLIESEYGFIGLDVSYSPIRQGGVEGRSEERVLILDNSKSHYRTRITKLIDANEPDHLPVRKPGETDEVFLQGKDFRVIEEFAYSEDPGLEIVHDFDDYEDIGEVNIQTTLFRLSAHLGYIASGLPHTHSIREDVYRHSLPEVYRQTQSHAQRA